MAIDDHVALLIVGAGPVGLALSLELSRFGVAHRLISANTGTSTHPKCNTTNARSMEHFRRLGIADRVRFGGLHDDYTPDVVYLTRLLAPEIARVRFPTPRQSAEGRGDGWSAWPTPEQQHRISQIFLEEILLDEAGSRPQASISLGRKVDGIAADAKGVTVGICDAVSGERSTIRADWVVGCDGGRSTIRKLGGLEFAGESDVKRTIFGGEMMATYYRSRSLARSFAGREGFMYWTLNPEMRSVTVAIDGKDKFLTHVQLGEASSADSADPNSVLPIVAGGDIDIEILSSERWHAGFRLVANAFRKGRIFLAGDAAHLFTPTGGFGMNTGIDDSANLAWKLAATIKGRGGETLLDSYEAERRPVAFRNTRAASDIADLIAGLPIPAEVENHDAAGDGARSAIRDAINSLSVSEFGTIGVQLGVRYNSTVIIPDGTAEPEDLRTQYEPTARPGSRLPHFILADGSAIYDNLGLWFTLIDRTGRASFAENDDPMLKILRLSPQEGKICLSDYILVRPDQHVAWRGDSTEDLKELMARALGRSSRYSEMC